LVQLINTGPSSLNAVVKDNAYKKGSMTKQLEPGGKASLLMHLRDSHGWYDFTATTDGSDTEARFAGRVETRGPSFTDPLMGSAL
jgi:phospholipase C